MSYRDQLKISVAWCALIAALIIGAGFAAAYEPRNAFQTCMVARELAYCLDWHDPTVGWDR
jgi:hypothetical protein